MFRDFRRRLHNSYSYIERIDRNWLYLLIGGFTFVSIWKLLPPLLHLFQIQPAAHHFGLAGNYLDYFLVTALVFYSIAHSDIVHGILSPTAPSKTEKTEHFTEQQVDIVVQAMTEKKLYLEPELTLEQLADRLGLSSRLLSNIINRKFKQNFFEFINYYRVEEAKTILSQPHTNVAMIDVMADAGFNSKSAFNRFFKKFCGVTPTEYKNTVGRDKTESVQANL